MNCCSHEALLPHVMRRMSRHHCTIGPTEEGETRGSHSGLNIAPESPLQVLRWTRCLHLEIEREDGAVCAHTLQLCLTGFHTLRHLDRSLAQALFGFPQCSALSHLDQKSGDMSNLQKRHRQDMLHAASRISKLSAFAHETHTQFLGTKPRCKRVL